MSEFPKLAQAPINEVVVGFVFEPIERLSPAIHGVYWERRRPDFPLHEIHTAITDVPTIWEGVAPHRTWLISRDETRLVQIQNDRFFVNWRKRRPEDDYPRFNTRDGRVGLLGYALEEYSKFSGFCESEGLSIRLSAIELTKIDLFIQGEHWKDLRDLSVVLPMIKPLADLSEGADADVALKFAERTGDVTTFVSVGTGLERQTQKKVIRLETRTRKLETGTASLDSSFKALNDRVNTLFFRFVPDKELERFGGHV